MIRQFFICYFFLIFACHLSAQAPSFHTLNYNIEDGLPSNECHDVLQDSVGYIWIATDRGLVRFNGYEFKTYGPSEGLTDVVCLDMVFDKDQNIYINTLGRKLFIYDQELDSIYCFSHQLVIDFFLEFGAIEELAIDNDRDELHMAIRGIGFLVVNINTGSFRLKRSKNKEKGEVIFLDQVENQWLVSLDNRTKKIDERRSCEEWFDNGYDICQFILEFKDGFYNGMINEKGPLVWRNEKVFSLRDSIILIQYQGINFIKGPEDSLINSPSQFSYLDILSYSNNGYLVGTTGVKVGLHYFSTIEELLMNESIPLVKDVSISRILQDNEGNIWCTSLDNGIYYLKKEAIKLFHLTNLESSNILDVEVGENSVYFIEGKENLIELKNENFSQVDYGEKDELHRINYVDSLKVLILANHQTKILDKNRTIKRLISKDPKLKNEITFTSTNNIFVFDSLYFFTGSGQLYVYNNIDSIQIYHSDYDENIVIRVLAVEQINRDSFLLGTTDGLKIYSNKTIGDFPKYSNELNYRINAIKKIGKWYAFGTLGNGLVLWDLKQKPIKISKKDGLISNNIESIFIDDQENIFLSTKSGLSKVWLNHNNKDTVKNYTIFHGLPSNEIKDVDQLGDTLFIATGKGLAILVDDSEPADLHIPFFTEIQVNDLIYSYQESPSQFKANENNIRISFETIDFKMQGKIPYLYRINEEEWSETYATEINFPALTPNNYTFSLKSKNRDDKWSDPIVYDFTIRNPWWKTNWFLLFCFLIIGIGSYLFYKNRINRLKEKNAIEQEIRELERSALQAQMSPHFIFNCLNSIQNFIIDSNKEMAMEYLGKFARLIRQSLNASVSNKIPLDLEIKMLTNYLELEKLRFKNKFNYQIILSDKIDPPAISVPTLLIQPFIENAIIHGMKNKTSGGLIEINFSQISENLLSVIVKDNGSGIEPNKISGTHKSLGTSITAKRLMLNNENKDDSFKILSHSSASGTTIQISIRI